MTKKTLSDCAACKKLSICDAHISGGVWKHRKGTDPCEVSIKEKY